MSIIKPLGIHKIKALGLNNTDGVENPPNKKLNIKYISCSKDNDFIYLNFEIETKKLNEGNATIFVQEMNATNEFAVSPYNLNVQSNGKTNVKTSFPINKKFDRYLWQDGLYIKLQLLVMGFLEKQKNLS